MEEKKFLERIKCYITKERKNVFLITFLTALIANFSYYSQLIAITDSFQYGSQYLPGKWEISLGRWGIYFFNKLRFGIVSPFFIGLISFAILGLISILINDILKVKSKVTRIIISMIIAVSPYVYNILLYTYVADSYFVSMLFSVLSVKFLLEESKKKRALGILCSIGSLSIYQSFISVTISFLFIILILDFIKNRINFISFIKKICRIIIDIIITLVIYYIITKIILKVLNIDVANYYGMKDDFKYIIQNIFNGIYGAYNDWIIYYFTNIFVSNSKYFINIIYLLIFIFININIVYIILKNSNEFQNIFIKILSWTIVFFILPILQNSIRLIVPTAALSQPMVVAYIIPIIIYVMTIGDILSENKTFEVIKIFEIILVLYLIYAYIFIGEATYVSLQKNYNQIYSQLIRVIDRIENIDNYSEEMKIKIIGGKDFREHIPIYDFSGLNTRMGFFGKVGEVSSNYLKEEFGIPNELATDEEMKEIYKTDEYKKMKEFPDKESIKLINNVIVVKLESNEYSINQEN